jgi:hydrogenase maturation protease
MVIRIGVMGIGNEACGDDAVGLVVARHLRHEIPDSVTVQEVRGEGIDLLDRWQNADAVILIDASCSGAAPGTIHRLDPLTQTIPHGLFPCSTHAFGVAEAIELARVLQQLPPRLVVYGVEGAQFDIGRELSAAVLQAVPEVVRQVRQDIAAFRAQETGDDGHA